MKKGSKLILGLMAASLIAACTKKKTEEATTGSSSDLTISGKLASNSSASVASALGKRHYKPDDVSTMAVSLSDLQFYAIAFTSPPQIATATVGDDGSFTATLAGAKGASVTAIFKDKNDGSQVGVVVFQDSSSKDLNGNDKESSSIVLSDSVSLGSIALGSDGKVMIPVTQIASQVNQSDSVAVGTAFDPTGVWYMKKYDGTVPTGYKSIDVCSMGGDGDGPCIGFPLTLVRIAGKKFTPNSGSCSKSASPVACADSDGTVGTDDRYAMSIWGGNFSQGIGSCGAKIGFSADEARAFGQISVSSLPSIGANAISFGAYQYSTPTGFGGDAAPFNLPWMKTGATASHQQQDCRPVKVNNQYEGWACKAKVKEGNWPGTDVAGPVYGWQVGIQGGGCYETATNKPVNVTNWANIGVSANCTQTDVSSTYGAGFSTHTCVYTNVSVDGTSAAKNITCKHTGGQYSDNSGAPSNSALSLSSGQYLGQPENLVNQGALCSSIGSATNSAKLAAYRCYAEAYWNASKGSTGCLREYNFNWAATTPADFAKDSDRGKPKMAFLTNILSYAADGQTATLEDEEINKITVNTGANSSTFCETSRRTSLTFKKVSATRILVDLKQKGQMNSTDAACQGAAKDALAGKNVGGGDLQHILTPQNMIFYADSSL